MSDNYYAQYNAINDAFASQKRFGEVMKLLRHHFSLQGVPFDIISPELSATASWRVYDSEKNFEMFPTFIQAFDYAIQQAITDIKAKSSETHPE